MPNKFKYFIPSIADVIFFVLFITLSILMPWKLLIDCDTGYHIKIGEIILQTFSIPQYDIFSFLTPPPRWIAFEWLSEVIMAIIHLLGGLSGIVIFFAFLISLTYYFLFKVLQKENINIIISVIIILLVITSSSIHWLARPHIFSLILLLAWYYILDLYQYKEKNYLYFLPFLMLIWVNTHGAFVLAFFLLCIYLVGNFTMGCLSKIAKKNFYFSKAKKLFTISLISFCTALINPHGLKGVFYPLEALTNKFMIEHIGEFKSPNFHDISVLPFEVFILLMIMVLALSRKKLNIIELLLLLLFTNMALYSLRNIPLYAIIAAPILARNANQFLTEYPGKLSNYLQIRNDNILKIDKLSRGYFCMLLPVILVLIFSYTSLPQQKFEKRIKPIAAVEFLKQEYISGNMFNEYEFGDYIIYAAHPQYKVFIDGRADMYGAEWFKEYYRIRKLRPGWEELLDKHEINFIIFQTDSLFVKYLLEKDTWKLIYSDEVASIFIKNAPNNKTLIKKYENVRPYTIKDENDDVL